MNALALIPVAIATASVAQAVELPSHIYEFAGSGADSLGGPSMQIGSGASYVGQGPTGGLRFVSNLGPTVTGAFGNPGLYSLEVFFTLDQMASYRRLIDWKNGTDEDGLYLNNGDLSFYGQNLAADTNQISGQMAHIVVTRDNTQRTRVFYNGLERISFADATTQDAVFSGPDSIARFFRDNGNESSSGFVDFIRIYDRVLTGTEVSALYNGGTPLRSFDAPNVAVPEPTTWAMLVTGFGMLGGALRRRRRSATASV